MPYQALLRGDDNKLFQFRHDPGFDNSCIICRCRSRVPKSRDDQTSALIPVTPPKGRQAPLAYNTTAFQIPHSVSSSSRSNPTQLFHKRENAPHHRQPRWMYQNNQHGPIRPPQRWTGPTLRRATTTPLHQSPPPASTDPDYRAGRAVVP